MVSMAINEVNIMVITSIRMGGDGSRSRLKVINIRLNIY